MKKKLYSRVFPRVLMAECCSISFYLEDCFTSISAETETNISSQPDFTLRMPKCLLSSSFEDNLPELHWEAAHDRPCFTQDPGRSRRQLRRAKDAHPFRLDPVWTGASAFFKVRRRVPRGEPNLFLGFAWKWIIWYSSFYTAVNVLQRWLNTFISLKTL